MDAAMGALSAERSGVGSALIMALRQVGGTIGVAVLGTVLSSGYRDKLEVNGLPAKVAEVVRRSVSAGVAAAQRIKSDALLQTVRSSYLHGMDNMLWVCGITAMLGILLTMIFLPRQADRRGIRAAEQTIGSE
jgi:hypothetical protein